MAYVLDSITHPSGGFILGSIEYIEGVSGELHATISDVTATLTSSASQSSLKARARFGVNVLEGDLRVYKNGIWERTELRTR